MTNLDAMLVDAVILQINYLTMAQNPNDYHHAWTKAAELDQEMIHIARQRMKFPRVIN